MTIHKWKDLKKSRLSQDKIDAINKEAQLEVEDLEMNLRQLRQEIGLTQQQMADALDVAQSQLSRMEHRQDHVLSTLRRYVRALGGDLEVVAVVGDKRVKLSLASQKVG